MTVAKSQTVSNNNERVFFRKSMTAPPSPPPPSPLYYTHILHPIYPHYLHYLIDYFSNKALYTATLVTCGWAGAVLEKVTRASGQELYAQKA